MNIHTDALIKTPFDPIKPLLYWKERRDSFIINRHPSTSPYVIVNIHTEKPFLSCTRAKNPRSCI